MEAATVNGETEARASINIKQNSDATSGDTGIAKSKTAIFSFNTEIATEFRAGEVPIADTGGVDGGAGGLVDGNTRTTTQINGRTIGGAAARTPEAR